MPPKVFTQKGCCEPKKVEKHCPSAYEIFANFFIVHLYYISGFHLLVVVDPNNILLHNLASHIGKWQNPKNLLMSEKMLKTLHSQLLLFIKLKPALK